MSQARSGVFQGCFARALDKSAALLALSFAACVNTDNAVIPIAVTTVPLQLPEASFWDWDAS